jgi:hypothetical protein
MNCELLDSTVKLDQRSGIFYCDTSKGQFSIYLPLPSIDSKMKLIFVKSSNDYNQVTIFGIFPNEADFIVFGKHTKELVLICEDNTWQCVKH